MSLTLPRMRYLVRKGLGGLDEADLDNTDVDELLNLSLWELSEKFPFKEKECLVTASSVIGQEAYALPSDLDALRSVSLVNDDGYFRPLRRMTAEWYAESGDDDSDINTRGQPERWMRRDDALIIYPTPDAVYTIRLEMWRTINSLLEGTVDAPDLPRNWHEIVVEGAITRGHYYDQDYNLAQQAENFRVSHVRNAVLDTAKEEESSRYAGLDVAWDYPDP